MLKAENLTKRYGRVQALAGFSLEVAAGEIVGLVGHNGAGKTTFIETATGLIRPDGGRVTVNGQDPARVRGITGVCPQQIGLYLSTTVREHLRLFGGLAGLRRTALRAEIDDLAESLKLTSFMDRPVGVLSGGQQRRTQAAVALINRPSLLLMDEPTAGADPETRQALLDVVKQRASEGAAVIYTTHYLPELTELAATIAVARAGAVIARGSAADLLDGLPGEVLVTFADAEVHVSTTDPTGTLLEILRDAGRPPIAVDLRKPSLDDLYRSLTVSYAH
ncbi:ABC transporter ATP-binding protein [Sphaerisporangium album]|uniref:ABC transporter ATP-binding protein n=1 Tax=Sphaerisporangium album TaxID=509200 RepID=A0A367FA93_9ACTN|nr:ABC transporter ATP-binding protein [Sphaerisporangium album]RCG26490.1 ABC transporter ATP-binding protein [Sphaerisporangium album]